MDSGCGEDDDMLDESFDVGRSLAPNEMIWLMDELLSREVAWHFGYPLSQTLFTSEYIETLLWPNPKQLDDAQFSNSPGERESDPLLHSLFRSYCLGLIKSCDLVLAMVTSQHYYEEEDLATQLYNRELLHQFSVQDISNIMEDAVHYLQSATMDAELKHNLQVRIEFRLQYLTMLSSHVTENASAISESSFEHYLLSEIRKSRQLGKVVPDSFTLKIQRRLASTVPPRPMVTIDEDRTFEYLNRFVRDCRNVFCVLCASNSQDLLTTYSIFSAQDPQPSAYVRALMQLWLYDAGLVGRISNEFDFVSKDMQLVTFAGSPVVDALVGHPAALKGSLRPMRQHINDFLGKNGRSFMNLWRTACLNRCRVRRTLCHAALEWDQIQAEAEELDDEIQALTSEKPIVYPIGGVPTFSYSLSSWVYHYKLLQLRLIVQSGFELEIYAAHELSSMYWFLINVCDSHTAHLERICFFISRREAMLPPMPRRSQADAVKADECRTSMELLYRQFSWLKATEATARSLHGLFVILQRKGCFQQPTTTYASDSLRYEIRMRPFMHLSIPEVVTFEQCQRLSKMEVRTDLEVLDEALAQVAVAKKSWDEISRNRWNAFSIQPNASASLAATIEELWAGDVRAAAKATIGASIALATLKAALISKPLSSVKATLPRRGEKDNFHPSWPVPAVAVH